MYIELFLLDNLLMDALLLRLAAALAALPAKAGRIAAFSLFGAIIAYASLWFAPLAGLPGKLLSAMFMALAIFPGGLAGYMRALFSTLASAFLVGGFAIAIAYASGGGFGGGVLQAGLPLRIALAAALSAFAAPRAIRAMRLQTGRSHAYVLFEAEGKRFLRRALIDSGCSLAEPLSGLPVIIVFAPELDAAAGIPIPIETVSGEATLRALRPKRLEINGRPYDALIAPSPSRLRGTAAIIPKYIFEEGK